MSDELSDELRLKFIGVLMSGNDPVNRALFKAECDDAIAMCEVAFWDEDINRTEVLNVVV